MAKPKTPNPKTAALRQRGCLNPRPQTVTDPLFAESDFFDARDLVQVKYEMVRRVEIDGQTVSHNKNRMVTMGIWLLGGSVAILGYTLRPMTAPPLTCVVVLQTTGVGVLGMGVSFFAGYISLLYGGYAVQNWAKANQLAEGQPWEHLVRSEATAKSTTVLYRWATTKCAKPCIPENQLPPVFLWFFGSSVVLLVVHFGFVIATLAACLRC